MQRRKRWSAWRCRSADLQDAALLARSARRAASICARPCARSSARAAMIALKRKTPRTRPPPLVILCDISGSMSRYSRIFLHFMHAVTNDRDRVYTFLFGTRLTNVTRYLRYKDIDIALDKVARRGRGLVRRHAHRPMLSRFQSQLVAPGAGPGRDRAPDHRRARPRRRRRISARRWTGCTNPAGG